MSVKNGILHYLEKFYLFNTAYNNAQAGFVKMAEATTSLLETVNTKKQDAYEDFNTDVKNKAAAVSAASDTDRASKEAELTIAQQKLKECELDYQILIQSITPICTAMQEQVKTNASGASLLPTIGESVLSILSKTVDLMSSVRA
ncbi:MAG: hypothetical protein WC371_01480 [Parachlamydiales bacterium]|jgi:hypothetical protein